MMLTGRRPSAGNGDCLTGRAASGFGRPAEGFGKGLVPKRYGPPSRRSTGLSESGWLTWDLVREHIRVDSVHDDDSLSNEGLRAHGAV